jgi:hypothetical protein
MSPVRSDSVIARVGRPTGREFLRIRSHLSGKEVKYDCGQPLDCATPLDLRRLIPENSFSTPNALTAFFAAIAKMSSAYPALYERYREGILRTDVPEMATIEDGVAELQGRAVRLDRFLRNLPIGTHFLEVCALDPDGTPQCSGEPSVVRYTRQKTSEPFVVSARPGLYRVSSCENVAGRYIRTTQSGTVLVAPPAAYERLSRDFEVAVGLTKDWRDDRSVTPFRRIYLHALWAAESVGGSSGQLER